MAGKGKNIRRAGIVGLGRIGNLFDADPLRKGVWTHAGAYEACDATLLVGGADPDPLARRRFRAMRPSASVYASAESLMEAQKPEIVSVCTAPERHAEDVKTAARLGARLIFCEKPLARTLQEGREMIEACRRTGAVLAVNHVRRWEGVYLEAKKLIREGRIGKPLSVCGVYSDNAFKVGAHLFDLFNFLLGLVRSVQGVEIAGSDPEDPAVCGVLSFISGTAGTALCTGRHDDLVFELDVLGEEGRVSVRDNGAYGLEYSFIDSGRFSGYRELKSARRFEGAQDDRRFVAAVESLAAVLDGKGAPACSGEDGFHSMAVAEALVLSARSGGGTRLVEGV